MNTKLTSFFPTPPRQPPPPAPVPAIPPPNTPFPYLTHMPYPSDGKRVADSVVKLLYLVIHYLYLWLCSQYLPILVVMEPSTSIFSASFFWDRKLIGLSLSLLQRSRHGGESLRVQWLMCLVFFFNCYFLFFLFFRGFFVWAYSF